MESEVGSKSVRLVFVEISNFKSFGGIHQIGPLNRNFISVVGSNGAGEKRNIYNPSFV
jgi:chromosome segregation ATPase